MQHRPEKQPDYTLVTQMAAQGFQATEIASALNISRPTHYAWLREDEQYKTAYQQGLNQAIEKRLNAITTIADNTQSSSASLEANKMLLKIAERQSSLAQEIDLEGNADEMLDKAIKAYQAGDMSNERFTRLMEAIRIKAKIAPIDERQAEVNIYQIPDNGRMVSAE